MKKLVSIVALVMLAQIAMVWFYGATAQTVTGFQHLDSGARTLPNFGRGVEIHFLLDRIPKGGLLTEDFEKRVQDLCNAKAPLYADFASIYSNLYDPKFIAMVIYSGGGAVLDKTTRIYTATNTDDGAQCGVRLK